MDSQDSSAPPSHHLHHHLQHQHHPQPPPHAVFLGQHTQNQPNNNSLYQLHNSSNSVASATSAAMSHRQQNPRFPFNSVAPVSAPKPLDHHYSDGSPSGGGGSGGFTIEPSRKKRGRPRKYSPDDSIGLGLSPAPVNQISSAVGHADSSGGGTATPSSETAAKRNRGRPAGSVKKQMDALGAPGVGFTPHVIMVAMGEDIASKILEFSQQGPRTVCILSANGSISNVTLRQPSMSGGTVSYEGRFEIISLSGSFLLSDISGNQNRTGGLSVSLAGSDGRVLGGGVGGMLKAASSVQVVVGSFIADGKKSKQGLSSPPQPPPHMLNFGTTQVAGVSPSPGASSESPEENEESPINLGSGPYGSVSQPIQNVSMYSSMGWANSIKMPSPQLT